MPGSDAVNSPELFERALACLYSSTPDEHFVFGPAPGFRHVALASACSGHGFKFTILSGETVARIAVGLP